VVCRPHGNYPERCNSLIFAAGGHSAGQLTHYAAVSPRSNIPIQRYSLSFVAVSYAASLGIDINNSANARGDSMTVRIERLERLFVFNGVKLPDPNPDFTVEQVRDMYVNTYPELATAAVEGPTPVNGSMQYTFVRAIGAKG
jgi:PRTRC genetic system protein C